MLFHLLYISKRQNIIYIVSIYGAFQIKITKQVTGHYLQNGGGLLKYELMHMPVKFAAHINWEKMQN